MKPGMRLYGTIINHTLNNTVSYANQLYDEDELKYQSLINDDFKNNIELAQNAIDILNASESTPGSVQYWIKLVMDTILDGAPEAFDTLKEIADWIAQDEHGTAALINRVATNEEAIATINTAISELRLDVESDVQELHLFKTEIRNEVEQDILDAVNDAKAREQEIWTDVSRVDGRVTTVSNKVTEVDNTVKGITDANGNIKYTEALQSVIDTGISNNTAFNNISARWAVLDENQQVLEWMAAGFKSQVSPSTSFASVYAAANQSTSNAISNLTTTINNLGDTYVAKARLLTEVESIVKNDIGIQSFSEIALDSDVSAAESRMVSRYTTLDNTVGSLSTSLAGVTTKADATEAKLNALATWSGNTPTGYKYTSGLVTEANKDSAIASLFAQGTSSTSKSNIMALITAEVQGEVSSLTLTADKIYLNANETLANTIRATQGTIGGFTIGSDSISYGDLVSGEFSIVADETNGPQLSIIGSAGLEESHGVKLNESGLTFYSNYRRLQQYVETNKINLDGSGLLASGILNWDANGNVTLGDGINGSVTIISNGLTSQGNICVLGSILIENSASQQPGYISYMDADDAIAVKNLHIGGVEQGASGTITFGDTVGSVYISEPEDDYLELSAANGVRILGELSVRSAGGGYSNVSANGVYASSFVKNGSSNDYVLLAGGGTKAISEFPSGGGNYLPLTGGTITGSLTVNLEVSAYSLNSYSIRASGITIADLPVATQNWVSGNYLPTELGNINGNIFRYLSTENSYGKRGSAVLRINENRVPSIALEDDADDDGDYNSVVVSAQGISFHEGDLDCAFLNTGGSFGFKELYDYDDRSLGSVYTSTIVDFFVNQVSSSDETIKNKVGDVELSVEQIASAPSIKYTWKDKEKGSKIYIGTTAQYWQDIIPEAVSEVKDGKLGLNYQGLSIAAVISLAREIVELKSKIKELENRS